MKTYPTVVGIAGFLTRFLGTPKLLKVWWYHLRVVSDAQIPFDAMTFINDSNGIFKRLSGGGVTR